MPPVSDVDAVAGPQQRVRDLLRAGDGAALALAEGLGLRDPQRDRLAGDHVHQRAALLAREDRRVDLLGVLLLQRIIPPRAPPSVLWIVVVTTCACGTGLGMQPGGDEPREVRHVDHQVGADLVGDLAEAREVELRG